jgi:hypothetical protein
LRELWALVSEIAHFLDTYRDLDPGKCVRSDARYEADVAVDLVNPAAAFGVAPVCSRDPIDPGSDVEDDDLGRVPTDGLGDGAVPGVV